MKEVEAYKLFSNSPGIIHSVDYSIASERGSDEQSKTVYVLLPYYRRGNLQDMINANLVNHTRFPEKRLMGLFLGVCKALREMHLYHGGGGGGERMEVRVNGGEGEGGGGGDKQGTGTGKRSAQTAAGADEEDEVEQQRPLMADEGLPGAGAGGVKSYSHRDIKPGRFPFF